jgi:hypothetical protein
MSFTYDVLGLGLVYYKNIIPNPQRIIDVVNDIDERYTAGRHAGHQTDVQPWSPWTYGNLHFNDQKFFPPPEQISPKDYYYKEMFEITTTMYRALDKDLNTIQQKSIHLLKKILKIVKKA